MVAAHGLSTHFDLTFQYSLCRVVLMVQFGMGRCYACSPLSVLALSSRFDGPIISRMIRISLCPFSTRSVESF